jgi:hypothetical protein
MAAKQRLRIYYRVGEETPQSTTWQLWAHGTSFYLTNLALGGLKISLHGWDSRHPSGAHFRVEPDPCSGKAIKTTNGVELLEPATGWPVRFTGKTGQFGDFAVRLRTTRGACELAPASSNNQRPSSGLAKVPAPPPGWAADLDLEFEQVPAKFEPVNNSPMSLGFGHGDSRLELSLRSGSPADRPGFRVYNERGAVLRGETRRRRLDLHPTPKHIRAREVAPASGQRGIVIDVADDGVLWIVEQPVAVPANLPERGSSSTGEDGSTNGAQP